VTVGRLVQPSAARSAAQAAVLVTLALLAACGKKGPPLAPLRVAPVRIEDLSVLRSGDKVRARFTVPAANDDKSTPADVVSVELLALSGEPQDALGQPLSGGEFVRLGEVAGRLEVKPVLPDAPAQAEAVTKLDPRPGPGEIGFITETLTPASRTPFVHPRRRQVPTKPQEEPSEVRPLTGPPAEQLLSRVYVATSLSRKNVRSGVSNRVAVPLGELPVAPPSAVNIDYSDQFMTLRWEVPAAAAAPIQRAAVAPEIAARQLFGARVTTTYNIYQVTRQDGVMNESTTPLNNPAVAANAFTFALPGFGVERCFIVRSGLQYGNARVEGPSSSVACVSPVDTFPPAAPKGLVAVGSEGGVSLIWDSNTESDLGGYVVMRGEVTAAGAAAVTLAPLMADPVKETTYRDNSARPGVRYVYAVVAVDTASPRNTSAESNRVEEGVR
jgi:hypothetical protein